MPNLNKVMIMGHLGKDPEIKEGNGFKIASFSVATSTKWKDKNTGEMQSRTEWHNITLFNKLAELADLYLRKGDPVYIEGEIRTEKYTDKEGVEKYSTKIIGNAMQLLRGKDKDGQETNNNKSAPAEEKFEDDIPF